MLVKTDTITIKVSKEEKKAIQQMAQEQDISVSNLLYKKKKKNGLI